MSIYKTDNFCNLSNFCILKCLNCKFFFKKDKKNDFGFCTYLDSENYYNEVYNSSCCTYLCKNKKKIKISKSKSLP